MNKFYNSNKVLTKNNNYAQIDASNYDYYAEDVKGRRKKHVFFTVRLTVGPLR